MSTARPTSSGVELAVGIAVGVVWTGAMALAAIGATNLAARNAEELALNQARTLFQTVTDFRSWATAHGGVYVPVTSATRPNPYLPAAMRVVRTTEGRELALVNPAMMTRQAAAVGKARGGTLVRITSLKPLRPANAPVDWERKALESIEAGGTQYADFSAAQDFHYLAPLTTEKACLACHAEQGYREGDVRGGISITMPAAPFLAIQKAQQRHAVSALAVVWLFGLGLITVIMRSFRRRRVMLDQAEELSLLDPLTSVSNRRGFMAQAEQATRSLIRRKESGVVLFIDVDCFKHINDTFGHEEGDAALRRIAELLRQTFRDSDIIGRLGGDEFAILMLSVGDEESDVARQRLEEAIEAANSQRRGPYLLSLSVGVVPFRPTDPTELEGILGHADRAMYTEKRRKISRPDHPAVVVP